MIVLAITNICHALHSSPVGTVGERHRMNLDLVIGNNGGRRIIGCWRHAAVLTTIGQDNNRLFRKRAGSRSGGDQCGYRFFKPATNRSTAIGSDYSNGVRDLCVIQRIVRQRNVQTSPDY